MEPEFNRTVSTATSSLLAFNMARYLIGKLGEKGLLTDAEVAEILRDSVKYIREDQRQPAVDLLRVLWPDFRV